MKQRCISQRKVAKLTGQQDRRTAAIQWAVKLTLPNVNKMKQPPAVLPASDSIVSSSHAGAFGICAGAPGDLWGGRPRLAIILLRLLLLMLLLHSLNIHLLLAS